MTISIRGSAARLTSLAIFLVVSLLAGNTPSQENKAADGMSAEHRLLHEKLSRKTMLQLSDPTVEEVLAELSKSLGAPVTVDDDAEIYGGDRFQFDEPITHWRAIERLRSAIGRQTDELVIDGDGIRVTDRGNTKIQLVLRRHDLSGFSDYTTAKRLQLIKRIRAEVSTDTWNKPGGAWIVASPSVFEIDVYQTHEVHQLIEEFFHKAMHLATESKPQLEHEFILTALRSVQPDKPLPEGTEEAFDKLRATFPYRSLSAQLKGLEPPLMLRRDDAKLAADVVERQNEREENFGRQGWKQINFSGWREASLKKLHNENVQEFVKQEGFGLTRISPPGASHLRLQLTPRLALPSADALPKGNNESPVRIPLAKAEAAASDVPLPTKDMLTAFHGAGEANFLRPMRFGYVKDRDHVAGFEPHAFTSVPRMSAVDGRSWNAERSEQWAVRRLELVSLLKHDKPAVYISDELPRMDELAEAPTRKLSDFEAGALDALINGEDVIARATTNRIEMVGSLRAVKQCADCHDAGRGELLGAFSYELIRDPAILD